MRVSGAQGVVAGAVLLVVVVSGVVVWAALRDAPTASPRTTSAAPAAVIAPAARDIGVVRAVDSLAVLRNWDRARAATWARGDVRALLRLYAPGSSAGRHDAAMLRRWNRRGLRVQRMSMQVLRVVLEERTARRLVLLVTDRLTGAVAVGRGSENTLPRDRATTRRLSFRRQHGRWLLASVSPSPDRS